MGCNNSTAKPKPQPPQLKVGEVNALHSASEWGAYYEAAKSSNKLIAVYFSAGWCGPCHVMAPKLEEFAARYTDVEIVKIDIDELKDVARKFVIEVVPTFVFLKRGKEVDRVEGAKKEELEQKLDHHRALY